MTAVRKTSGSMSNPRPKAVREITCSERPVPPWNRIRETPMVKTSCAPTPSKGLPASPQDRRPDQGPHRDEHHHLGQPEQYCYCLRDKPRSNDETKVPECLFGFHDVGEYTVR